MAVQEHMPGATRIITDAGPMWYPESCRVLTPALVAEGRWEPTLRARLERCARPGMAAVVAGAHVGYFVRHLSRLVGSTGRVVAVEPAPDNVNLLRANVREMANVEVIPAAAWASSGTLELNLSESNTGDHRAVSGAHEPRERLRVPAIALDEVLADADRLDVVLLDAQASEPLVLAGLQNTLMRFMPRLFVELWPSGLRDAGHDPAGMVQMLSDRGYRLKLLEGRGADLVAAAEASPGGYATLEAERPKRRRGPLPPRHVPYGQRRAQALTEAFADPRIDAAMSQALALPRGYGRGLDERVIELPWAVAQLTAGRWLDAGSTFNAEPVLRPALGRVDRLTIVTSEPEAQSFTQLGVSYVYGDLRELPFRDDWFAGVSCVSTLEHVGMDNRIYGDQRPPSPDPSAEAAAALRELRRVVRPGGRLLLSVPFGRGEDFGWFRQFNSKALFELIGDQGTMSVFCYLAEGWQRSTPGEAADARYRDAGREPCPADGAIAARAVACVVLDC